MSITVNYKSAEKIHAFNGKEYPFSKNKMCIRLNPIGEDIWRIVKHAYVTEDPPYITRTERRYKQLDSQVNDVICSHLSMVRFA